MSINSAYSWPLRNVNWNCMGPLTNKIFLIVNTEVLPGLWLADSTDMEEPWIWRANHRLYMH